MQGTTLPEWTDLLFMPVGVAGVASWGFGPFIFVIALLMLVRDSWRTRRSWTERLALVAFVLGSPVAWFGANLIADKYHVLR